MKLETIVRLVAAKMGYVLVKTPNAPAQEKACNEGNNCPWSEETQKQRSYCLKCGKISSGSCQ